MLTLGMGAAAQLAALNAYDANPDLNILIVTKALRGKGGCSRMVQGGFNVVLDQGDSHQKHFMDTLKGGQFINNQEMAKTLVEQATYTIKEMETIYGCFFDRKPDGTVHQKAFAGQSFDRTVHKGDLTGIEIISRTTEQIMKRGIRVLEEHRALDLLYDRERGQVTGALVMNIRTGELMVVEAAATLVATGGGPTCYRLCAPGPEKSLDGLAMLYRAGVEMMDMEMIQFHPTGLIVPGSVVAGALLEEGLRGAGAYLYNSEGERYMLRYDPEKKERATRDVVSRSSYLEIMAGRGYPGGGVMIDAAHLGKDFVEKNFPGMTERTRLFGYDLARKPVEVSPTAHFLMGGAVVNKDTETAIPRLFVAGEDAGGVHGANRLGGNGIADSCVFGRQSGKAMARFLATDRDIPESDPEMVQGLADHYRAPLGRVSGPVPADLRDRLRELNWIKVGIVRQGEALAEAQEEVEELMAEAMQAKVPKETNYNMIWGEWLSLVNMLDFTRMSSKSASLREETRGAHARSDFPEQNDATGLYNIFLRRGEDGRPVTEKRPVDLKYASPPSIAAPKEA
ncbi:FAD-binding protein [Desulfoferula mesophila]|uniref:Fumarate reductase n=1 Tax=Desulfoferula mesophila TaxID=3058419 RepID=A0AAU9EMK4_9BACT|nr:fumarate reductase [Desulfoferula mesophilus]